MHFGRAPWEWLYELMRHPIVLRVIEINYETLWFIICFGAQYWVAVSRRFDGIRLRYVLCFILTWVLIGDVAATVFSSAGPVYYGLVTGDFHRFADLMVFTRSTAGQFGAATDFQSYLWYLHSRDIPGLGSGISAFPSMHVAIIVRNVLFLCEADRKWLVPSMLYVGFTIASSVYLGWHYAVDGYAAAIMAAAIFFGLKRVMSIRWSRMGQRAAAGAMTVAD